MPPQQHAQYDFVAALSSLQERIQSLSEAKQQVTPQTSRLGSTWSFLKANRGNLLLLVTFYSMSTASVLGSIAAQHRLQSDRLLETKEQEQLQHHIHGLEQQVSQQQQLLDALAADLEQRSGSSSSSGGWWGAGAVRQQMMQRLQQWRTGQQPLQQEAGAGAVSNSSSSSSQQQEHRQQESFGVKVGYLGSGFLI